MQTIQTLPMAVTTAAVLFLIEKLKQLNGGKNPKTVRLCTEKCHGTNNLHHYFGECKCIQPDVDEVIYDKGDFRIVVDFDKHPELIGVTVDIDAVNNRLSFNKQELLETVS